MIGALDCSVNVTRGIVSDPFYGLEGFVNHIAAMHRRGTELVVVATGATKVGQQVLGPTLQSAGGAQSAAAAIGQIRIAQFLDSVLSCHGIVCAQLLLSSADLSVPGRRRNLVRTLSKLLAVDAVPIASANHTMEDPGPPSLDLTGEVAKLLASVRSARLSSIQACVFAPAGEQDALANAEFRVLSYQNQSLADPQEPYAQSPSH